MDTTILVAAVATGLCGAAVIYTTAHWRLKVRSDARDYDCCITDIRAMNTYNSYFLAGILIFFGLIIEKGPSVPKPSLGLIIAAFLSASLAIFWIPLTKSASSEAGKFKVLWLYTLILTQFTVILTAVGVLSAIFCLL